MTKQALIAKGLTRTYNGQAIVSDVHLTLEPGTITALLGPSGAGKSTLLRLFAGLERPEAGTLTVGNSILASPDHLVPTEKRQVGLIFQDFALFPHLTAQENIRFGLRHLTKQEGAARALDWLRRIGLETRSDAYPHQLSGGEQQRIAIARALAPDPVVILMDEPFSGLDPALREEVRTVALDAIASVGIPGLLVTHDADEAMLFADRLAIMRQGRILQTDTPDVIYSAPADADVAIALGPLNTLSAHVDETGKVITPIGTLAAPDGIKSASVDVLVRPEAILLDRASAHTATLISIRRRAALHQLVLDVGPCQITALVSHHDLPETGSEVGVRLDPALAFIFRQ